MRSSALRNETTLEESDTRKGQDTHNADEDDAVRTENMYGQVCHAREDPARAILECIKVIKKTTSRALVTKYLRGSSSREVDSAYPKSHDCYGSLSHYSSGQVKYIIGALVDQGLLEQDRASRGHLVVTEKGHKYLAGEEDLPAEVTLPKPAARPRNRQSGLKTSYRKTLEMHLKGYIPEEIAKKRLIHKSTVMEHLTWLAKNDLFARHIVVRDRCSRINAPLVSTNKEIASIINLSKLVDENCVLERSNDHYSHSK